MTLTAETLTVGSELLAGNIVDTNATWLATRATGLGITLDRHTALPDRLDDLVAFLRDFRRRATTPTCLLVTGGLGPTRDDLTRDAVARAFDAPLEESAECREAIEAMFRRNRWPLAESNYRQAMIPRGASPLPNSCGTAPGFHLAEGDLHVVCVPGVPAEMRTMFDDHVMPILRPLAAGNRVICERMLHTFGMGESSLGQRIAEFMVEGRNPEVGTLACEGLVRIRMRATAETTDNATALLDRDEGAMRRALGDVVFGRDGDGLSEVVVRLLADRGASVTTAESCTGGLIAKMITDVSGASDVFAEGLVTYANGAKVARLGVPEELLTARGAVSEPVVRAMAEGARDRAGATYALATSGIAGPTGGTPDKPVGLVHLALAGPDGTESVHRIMHGDRGRVRRRAALTALNLLRLSLLKSH